MVDPKIWGERIRGVKGIVPGVGGGVKGVKGLKGEESRVRARAGGAGERLDRK